MSSWGKPGRGNKGQLLGEFGTKRSPVVVDVWDQQGIYVLAHEWQVVYVGKADKVSLGTRLRTHLSDELAGRCTPSCIRGFPLWECSDPS